MSTLAKKLNASLNLTSRLAVVAGGSQGIGAGVAVRFAEAGSSVLVVGRNERLLEDVVQHCKRVARGGPTGKVFEYIRADLSTSSGIKQTVEDIKRKSGRKVDYLVQTQGGPPNGRWKESSEGLEFGFSVQVLSRFALSYLLAESGVLKRASIAIGAPGYKFANFDVADIECRSAKDSNALSRMLTVGKRDGMLTDTWTKALQTRFPNIDFYHLFPGLVTTNSASNQGFPFPLPQLFALSAPILSRTIGNSPASYAEIPVMLAANDSPEKKELVAKTGNFLNERLKMIDTSGWSTLAQNQNDVFEKLKSYLKP